MSASRTPRPFDTEELMKLSFAIETSQPSGAKFRLAFGITIPLVLIGTLIAITGLL